MIVNVWYCSKHKNILPATELIHTISDICIKYIMEKL